MANRRMITTAIWGDEFFGMLDNFQRVLWIGIFSAVADDQGRMIDNLHLLKSKIFIYDDFDPKIIDSALELFQQEAKILRYKIGNKRYIQIINWWKHQQPQWAQPSQYPAPDGWTDSIRTRINGQYLEENWHNGGYNLDCSPEVVPEQAPEPTRRIVYPDPNPDPVKEILNSANAAPSNPLSISQRYILDAFGAKRFKTNIQKDAVLDAENKFGADTLEQYIIWAAKKGLSLGDTIGAMEKSLPKWGKPKGEVNLYEELEANGYTVRRAE